MEKQFTKNQMVLSEDISSIIAELIEKYKLEEDLIDEETKKMIEEFGGTSQERSGLIHLFSKKLDKMLSKAKTPKEREKIIEDLPSSRLAQILKELEGGKITIENLISSLQTRLNISEEVAKNLARDLKQKIPSLAEIKKERKKEVKKEIKKEVKPPIPAQKDIYREPIE